MCEMVGLMEGGLEFLKKVGQKKGHFRKWQLYVCVYIYRGPIISNPNTLLEDPLFIYFTNGLHLIDILWVHYYYTIYVIPLDGPTL